jgi:hypothetical protein
MTSQQEENESGKQENKNDKIYEIIKKDCEYDLSFKIIVIGNSGKKIYFLIFN